MIRRTFLTFCAAIAAATAVPAFGLANRRFAFKIKTKDKGIVGNIVIEASDVEAAKVKLMKRYPGCTVLSVSEKLDTNSYAIRCRRLRNATAPKPIAPVLSRAIEDGSGTTARKPWI